MAKRKPVPQWCYDLETTAWNQVLTAVGISDAGDVVEFDVSRTANPDQAMADHIAAVRGTWRAHAGGMFDHLLMWRHIPPTEVILAGSTALRARDSARHLTWRDTLPWWLAGLDRVGKATGVTKLPDVDRRRMAEMDPAARIAYCRRDVETLWSGVRACWEFLDAHGARRGNTSGACAVNLLRALDPQTWQALQDNEPAWADLEHAQGHIMGGRVESRVLGTVPGPIYCYDVHSSYPSRYSEGPIPVGLLRDSGTSLSGVWWGPCEWHQPPLPPGMTPPEIGRRVDGPPGLAGVGNLTGWLTSETAGYLTEHGIRVRRLPGGFRPAALVNGFAATFTDVLYRAKEGKGAPAFFAKVFLNSLHGKLSEGLTHWVYRRDPDETAWRCELAPDLPRHLTPYMQPMAGAFVLQRARRALHRAIHAVEQAGGRVFYFDTDCIHTDMPPEKLPSAIRQGPAMGEWGLEAVVDVAHYLAPKLYCLGEGEKAKVRSKGIPKGALSPIDFLSAQTAPVTVPTDSLDRFRGAVGAFNRESGQVTGGHGFGQVAARTRTVKPVLTNRFPAAMGNVKVLTYT